MEILNTTAAICSIIGIIFSFTAAVQASRASKSASAAHAATLIRSLSDDLQLACTHGEQLVDYLKHSRYKEAYLRINELIWSLSELPHRRSPNLSTKNKNILLSSRYQLTTISDAFDKYDKKIKAFDTEQIIKVARKVTMNIREVLGEIRSDIEHGEPQ